MGSSSLWKHVYRLARSFCVTPTMMKRSLMELGWLRTCDDHRGGNCGLELVGRP